jgi:allantoin racemase
MACQGSRKVRFDSVVLEVGSALRSCGREDGVKILVINPNTTQSMTRAIESACRSVVRPSTELLVTNPASGVASIEGNADGVIAAGEVAQLVREHERSGSVDGYVIACFDDTGLHAARELARGPVVGIGEAALHFASLISARFSVLTSVQRSVTILERNARSYGFSGDSFRIHAAEIPVLDLESEASYARLFARAKSVLAADHAECLVLGCGGMSHLGPRLASELGLPVVDGVKAALGLVESLCAMGLGTSKASSYAYPLVKTPGESSADKGSRGGAAEKGH